MLEIGEDWPIGCHLDRMGYLLVMNCPYPAGRKKAEAKWEAYALQCSPGIRCTISVIFLYYTDHFVPLQDYVLSVATSPDGALVVSGSKDRGVLFWNSWDAQPQCMLQGHKNSGKPPLANRSTAPFRKSDYHFGEKLFP
jgi:WD40 repeat protein